VSTPSRPTDQPVSGSGTYSGTGADAVNAADTIAPDTGKPGFGVYLHWPFCAAKCPYCDFNSHVRHAGIDQQAYVAAFKQEIAAMRAMSGPQGCHQHVLWRRHAVADVARHRRRNSRCGSRSLGGAGGIEITLEANPSSVEAGRFRGYRQAGVNRVSMGVQALNDPDLKRLGRLHDRAEALKAIGLAREIFPRMSFDLIYARPDQTRRPGQRNWRKPFRWPPTTCRSTS
jgi:coproporphyrinogen III oxidase-like Fe-S oxidoreductase